MPSVASVLRAACALPLAAASLDSIALIQGGAQVRRELPKELKNVYLSLERAAQAANKEEVKNGVGDVAYSSGIVAARLPDDWPISEAWGQDKLKAVGVAGLNRGNFAAGGFVSSGTDAKEEAHVLGGAGYAGIKPDNLAHVPSAYGAVSGALATPGELTVVGALPVLGKSNKPEIVYGRSDTKFESGHVGPSELPDSLKPFVPVWKAAPAVLATEEAEREEAAEEAKPAEEAEHEEAKEDEHKEVAEEAKPEPEKAAAVQVEEVQKQAEPEPSQAVSGPELVTAVAAPEPVTAVAAPAEPAKVAAEQEPAKIASVEALPEAAKMAEVQAEPAKAVAQAVEEVVDPEQEKKNKDFAEYELKLMFLDFPFESAYWWSLMRGWATESKHQLPAEEERQRLGLLEGSWTVEKDAEFPQSEGSVMTIQDGKLMANGEHLMETKFKAYTDGKYSTVTPLVSKLDNSTVELFRIFTINGTALQFEGGNLWRRVGAAPTAPPAPQRAISMAWQPPALPKMTPEQMKAAGGELLKKLGAAFQSSITPEQVKKATDAANGFRLVMQGLLKKPRH